VLGILLLGLGLALAARGLRRQSEPIALPQLRPVVLIAAAIILFALTLTTFGLAPAIMLLVVVSAYASPVRRPLVIGLLGIGLTIFAYVVFVRLLSLHLDLLRW
jgi:hypothetical protein